MSVLMFSCRPSRYQFLKSLSSADRLRVGRLVPAHFGGKSDPVSRYYPAIKNCTMNIWYFTLIQGTIPCQSRFNATKYLVMLLHLRYKSDIASAIYTKDGSALKNDRNLWKTEGLTAIWSSTAATNFDSLQCSVVLRQK